MILNKHFSKESVEALADQAKECYDRVLSDLMKKNPDFARSTIINEAWIEATDRILDLAMCDIERRIKTCPYGKKA